MKIINSIIFIFTLSLIVIGCKRTDEAEFILPKDYLPAYPGSYWDYTNGERVLTSPNYVLHSFQDSLEAIKSSEDFYVPMYNNQYLYEYCITTNLIAFPVIQLLEENTGEEWVIKEIDGHKIKRQVVSKLDSIVMPWPTYNNKNDTVFYEVVAVVEFLDSLGKDRWNLKEYYAKNVGLIRVEANNPFDTLDAVILKDLQGFRIRN